jgi:glutaminyl-peptide cyclotransferase
MELSTRPLQLLAPCAAALAFACVSLAISGCDRKAETAQKPTAPPKEPTLWKEFSGEKAFEHVAALVAIGPRPSGTASLETARQQITSSLKASGWTVERQEFEATPIAGKGALKFVNLIGRFPASGSAEAPKDTQRVIVASHYDTKRMLGVSFVGANDGGSSTGALMELARVAARQPEFAKQLELVFFDGEEAIETFGDPVTGTDGLVGSRHYAVSLRDSGRAKQFRAAILWDMIGDKELKLTLPSDTPPPLAGGIITASEQLGLRKHVGYFGQSILDDHVPLAKIARIPAMDMIDFDYAPWHTSGDTLDRLSPDSLRIIGQLTLWYLEREFAQ